ncbi:hypothetical protein [Luteimicrobium subarcticum]|uniref:Uncharacterized protein n=1 Tax=Luteimicrobium subarcticum TaxID=620910 RepID=A0A2M8WSR9_9MICO|nr:hypothetical protein [Luteimicrobium subarcticum]PJI93991.1 hypothetical protein CLV34_1474 [Luteimicrobium subarcticum]
MPADTPPPPDDAPVRRLGRVGRTWRLAAAGTGLVVLVVAQLIPPSTLDTNDWFPLGSLSQYAFAGDPNGVVASSGVVGVTADGTEVSVWLDQMGIGVGHAEIEAQVDRIVADPSLLQDVADAYAWRFPDRAPLVEVRLERTTTQLHDGKPTADRSTEVLATWDVEDAGGSGTGSTDGTGSAHEGAGS